MFTPIYAIIQKKKEYISGLLGRLIHLLLLLLCFLFSAYVWGTSVKHNPQKVGKEHVLKDEDVVQIVKKI